MTVSSLNLNVSSQQTCHHFLSGESSVHSTHSPVYSKTLPPHLSSLSLLKKHASVHWSALVRPTKLHLCKLNEVISTLQLPCVSQIVGSSFPCGLVFSRVEKAWKDASSIFLWCPKPFFTLLYLAFSLDYDNTTPIYLNYSSSLKVNKTVCKNTLAPFCQSTYSSKSVPQSQRPKPCLCSYLYSQIFIPWVCSHLPEPLLSLQRLAWGYFCE